MAVGVQSVERVPSISKLYKLFHSQYVDADHAFLGQCMPGADGVAGVLVRGYMDRDEYIVMYPRE